MAEEHELIKKHTNEAIQALVPLLDNEKTRHIGHVLLKAIDLGLGLLEGDTNGANNQIKVSGASPPGTVPQNFQKDVEQENRVQGLVDETLKELEMMDNHESNPITTDKDGNEIEYVKGMLCNCQFASEFHKYCDNQCKETLIKAEGDPKEYIKFIDKERKEQDTKSLDEAMDDLKLLAQRVSDMSKDLIDKASEQAEGATDKIGDLVDSTGDALISADDTCDSSVSVCHVQRKIMS